MRRLARILGVIGGIGAVLWAMRDRLLSVAIPREPQLPDYRAPGPPGRSREEPGDRDEDGFAAATSEGAPHRSVTDVKGIGPVYATRLEASDITTLTDLAAGTPAKVAEAAGVAESTASGWIDSARDLVGG